MLGANKLIQNLHSNGYFIGVISNGAHLSRESTVASLLFSDLIGQLVSSGSFGAKKPSPEIFTESVSKAGFKPSECVYVGDHPVNDIQGSLNAGIEAIFLSGYHSVESLPKNVKVVNELSEIMSLIESP